MIPPVGAAVRGTPEPRGWKPGPLPEGTWYWGAVALVGESGGFHFADFRGDHALIFAESADPEIVEAAQVKWYDNGLTLPPDDPARGG